MGRVSKIVVGMAVLIAACGGNVVSTTTTPTAADSHREPLAIPARPEVLLLTTQSGNPESASSFCIDFQSESGVWDEDHARSVAIRAITLLGIEVVPENCDATLRVDATGERTFARYSVGECWEGWEYEIEVELVVDGTVVETWMEGDREAPPATIPVGSCTGRGAFVLDSNYSHTYLDRAFAQMWGNPGALVLELARAGLRFPEGLQITDEIVQILAFDLMTEPVTDDFYDEPPVWALLRDWTDPSNFGGPDPRTSLLEPLSPVLITLLERAEAGEQWQAYGTILPTLENLSGEAFGSPAEWWDWWEGR